jgi:hypothetical protein
MLLKSIGKAALPAFLAVSVAGLGGCGADDVQLNGKIFDAMGLNTTGSVHKGDPKMAAREPLVIPPNDQLPAPGSGQAHAPALAEINDPDAQKKTSKAELERQQAEYCEKYYKPAVMRGDDSADAISGPLGSCHPSVFTAIKKWTSGDDGETE